MSSHHFEYKQNFTIPNNLPLWAFFNSDEVFNEPELSEDEFWALSAKLRDHLKIIQDKIIAGKLDEVMPLFEERNNELDKAFYYSSGVMEAKLRDSFEVDFPQLDMLEIEGQDVAYENEKNFTYEILAHYFSDYEYNEKFKNSTYMYEKYNFLISSFYDENIIDYGIKDLIFSIQRETGNQFFQIFLYIFVITIALVAFTFIFSNFIKTIFNEYNNELQTKKISLEHWKKRFELAIIASNDGLWDIDFKTKKIYFSDKWLDMFGYNKGEVETFSDWFNLIHNEDKTNVEKLFDKIFAKNDDTFICEYRLQTKNDGFRWVLARGKSFVNDNNELDRMLMMSMDIDKNKRMKKELLDVELLVEESVISVADPCFNVFSKLDISSIASSLSEGEGKLSKSGGKISGSFF